MLAIRLNEETEQRLTRLAKRTGRTKTFYAREAILEHLEDMEDAFIALYRMEHPQPSISSGKAKRELGV